MKKPIGYISYTHGLDGKVKIVPLVSNEKFKHYIQNNAVFIDYNNQQTFIKITIFAFTGKIFICKIENITNIETAKHITKKEIFIETNKDDDYINPQNLINYNVFLDIDKNKIYGKILSYGDYGCGDVVEIITPKGKREYYICNKSNILDIDKDKKYIILKWMEKC